MSTEVNKTIKFKRLCYWCYRLEGFVKYSVDTVSRDMTIALDIQDMLMLLPQQVERLRCWY
jgi:hypothetical protein